MDYQLLIDDKEKSIFENLNNKFTITSYTKVIIILYQSK